MRFLTCLGAAIVALIAAQEIIATEPLHSQVDRLIEAKAADVEIAPAADNAEFLRRVYLDLAGRIPTVVEANAFFADAAKDKRHLLIRKLLAGPDYPRRMQELFHVMLMERRGDHDEWLKFLRVCFEQNKPWHVMARAILNPDAGDEELRGAAFFVTQRLVKEGAMAPVDVPGLTRDVGRLLAGVDLQCAQCHDHLTIPHYEQKDFQGLHMIFENVQTRRDVKFPAVSQKVMKTKKEFKSVFEQVALQTGPVVPGRGEVEIPVFEKGEEFAVAYDPKTRKPGIPKFSPLNELSTGLAAKDNDVFTRNIVNRLWFVMMGRGLVEPLDLQHADNPPTHPELLSLLATEFATHDFDIRWFLSELANSKTYQRSSILPDETEPPRESYAVAIEKRVSAEQLYWSVGIATGRFEAVRRSIRKGLVDAKKPEEELKAIDEATLEELIAKSEELKTALDDFKKNFGNGPKEPEVEFAPTVRGALFLMHGSKVQKCLESGSATLIGSLLKEETDQAAIDQLFVRLLARKPAEEESTELSAYLEKNKSRRSEALANIAWAILTSTEFVVNH